MHVPVLLYHHVGPPQPDTFPELTVSPARFARHVRWLAQCGYLGIRPAELLAWCREGKPLPRKPVLVTFDDAYADIVHHALPVLRRYGFGAAVFVVTGHLGGENRWDQAHGSGPHRLMTAEQIQEWAGRGIEFGAHSRTHADLTALSRLEVEHEVRGSRDDLAAITGAPVASFAYPFGRINQSVGECVRDVFDCAFSSDAGANAISSDLHALRRSMVQPHDSIVAVTCRVWLGRYPLDRWRTRLRVRSRVRRAAARLVGSTR